MAHSLNTTAQEILNTDQALIPQHFKKTLQSKVLMGHYQDSITRRQYDQRGKIDEKIREMENSQKQNERHLFELGMKKQQKQNTKNQYSKVYDQMIVERKEREHEERERQLWLERKLLNEGSWLRDPSQQKDIEKQKRILYAKELEKLMKQEEDKRLQEAHKFKDQVQKVKKDSEDRVKLSTINVERSRSNFDPSHSPHIGVKDMMVWNHHPNNEQAYSRNLERPLTPRMQRMLKVQQQRYYDKGKQIVYKSQGEKQYYESLNPQRNSSYVSEGKPEGYNPITNPIPYQYRNPNILKFISQYG